jgi:membrane protein
MHKKVIAFVRDLLKAVAEDDVIAYAHQLTLSLIMAFFPFVMFLFTLLAYFNIDTSVVLRTLEGALPASTYNFIADIIIDVLDKQRGGLLSVAIFLAVYSASGGFRAFMKGSNRVLGIKEQRNFVWRYVLSIVWVVLFALTLVVMLVMRVFGRNILDLLEQWIAIPMTGLINVLRWALPLVMIALILTIFYMFGAARRVRFLNALPGAIVTALGWGLFTAAFQYYVDNFAQYSRFYGTLGALIALLIWLELISIILLFGVELNSVVMAWRGIDPVRPGKGPFKKRIRHN